jgi:hypothetical protein
MTGQSSELGGITRVQGLERFRRTALRATGAHLSILNLPRNAAKTDSFAHVIPLARRLLLNFTVFEREYIGMVPDDFLDLYLDAMMRRVAENAPYGANLHAKVERSHGGYMARLDVETPTGPFVGESVASDPKLALDLAEEQLSRKLERWRKTRWDDRAA